MIRTLKTSTRFTNALHSYIPTAPDMYRVYLISNQRGFVLLGKPTMEAKDENRVLQLRIEINVLNSNVYTCVITEDDSKSHDALCHSITLSKERRTIL